MCKSERYAFLVFMTYHSTRFKRFK